MTQPGREANDGAPAPRAGLVVRTLRRWLMRPARVAAVKTLSRHFRLVDLEGEALRNVVWTAGQKIQIAIGAGLTMRTYTPTQWDADAGATRLLAFAHGDAPGSRWAVDLRQGDSCQFTGPRRSLDLSAIDSQAVLFGDETSFGLAAALHATLPRGAAAFVFEVSDVVESHTALAAVGIIGARLIERLADDAHLAEVATQLAQSGIGAAHFVLTGKASSIRHVSRSLKAAGVASSRIRAKAYWATGKTGLD
jgi:NADPH-dependent ferric siderophore reductase